MDRDLTALYMIHASARSVADTLLEGLKQPPQADPKKFTPEAKQLMESFSRFVHERFSLEYPQYFDDLPAEYWQVVYGLAEICGLRNHVTHYEPHKLLVNALKQLGDVISGQNERKAVQTAFRFCNSLAGECCMACVVPAPEEIVVPECEADEISVVP